MCYHTLQPYHSCIENIIFTSGNTTNSSTCVHNSISKHVPSYQHKQKHLILTAYTKIIWTTLASLSFLLFVSLYATIKVTTENKPRPLIAKSAPTNTTNHRISNCKHYDDGSN